MSNYKEFRKRAVLFRARLKLDKRANQAALLSRHLTGTAWEACNVLAVSPATLEDDDDAFDKLLALVVSRFRCDSATELPKVFEEYLFRANRRQNKTMFDF